jgi:hypothetical protein
MTTLQHDIWTFINIQVSCVVIRFGIQDEANDDYKASLKGILFYVSGGRYEMGCPRRSN